MRVRGGADHGSPVARALERLGWLPADAEVAVEVAADFRTRLLGFTVRSPAGPDGAPLVLVFPRCRAVHTCFMRFALDIAFADEQGGVLAVYEGVAPWRFVSCSGAAFVLERAAAGSATGEAGGSAPRVG